MQVRSLIVLAIVFLSSSYAMGQYQVTLPAPPAQKTITVHTTDLYYAPWDWDDLNDATIMYALGRKFADLKAYVMDEPFTGWTPGVKASRGDGRTWQGIYNIATGMNVPYYSGLPNFLSSTTDDGQWQPAFHHAGRDAILNVMTNSPDHSVTLHAVGSPRDIAAAYNRNPGLFAQKVRRIYLSGGREGVVGQGDANWGSDPKAVKRLLTSGLPMYLGLISTNDSRHDKTYWSMDMPSMVSVTDQVNPKLSQVVHWGYYCAMDGGYRAKHGIPFPNRPDLPDAIKPPVQFQGNNTMADPQAFFDEPTLPAIDNEIRGGGLTKAMWSPINFIDAVGLKIFKQGNQIKLSYNDTEPGFQRVGFYQPVLGTVDGNNVFTYALVPEAQANMHVWKWETSSRGEYGDIMNAVCRELVGTYLPEPGTVAFLALGAAALLKRRR